MTASSSEPAPLAALAARIRDELADLDAVVQRALTAWPLARLPSTQSAHLDSVALNLHSFYSGIERLFELIARDVDGMAPGGEAWHRDLLDQMTREVAGTRPAVIGAAQAVPLDDLRRFRHVVRHAYAIHLDAERMAPLMESLPALWREVRADLIAFADFLDDLTRRRTRPASS